MRLLLSFLVFSLAGLSFAQDTNFPAGPQYLITTSSPMLLHTIATPSLSFSSAIPDAYAGAGLVPSQISSSMTAPPSETFLGEVYWGEHKPDEIVARRITTPSLTADQTAFYTYATANFTMTPMPQPPTAPVEMPTRSSVIEITSAQMPANLPASIFDPGVTGTTDVQALLSRGYGISLGELARYWKSHKRPATHVFTNEYLHHE